MSIIATLRERLSASIFNDHGEAVYVDFDVMEPIFTTDAWHALGSSDGGIAYRADAARAARALGGLRAKGMDRELNARSPETWKTLLRTAKERGG